MYFGPSSVFFNKHSPIAFKPQTLFLTEYKNEENSVKIVQFMGIHLDSEICWNIHMDEYTLFNMILLTGLVNCLSS